MKAIECLDSGKSMAEKTPITDALHKQPTDLRSLETPWDISENPHFRRYKDPHAAPVTIRVPCSLLMISPLLESCGFIKKL